MEPDLVVPSARALASGGREALLILSSRVDCGTEESECDLVPVPQVSGGGVGFAGGAGADGVEQNCKLTTHLLLNLDCFQFQKAVFSRSYSSNVAVLLASAYRDSSNRQAEVA